MNTAGRRRRQFVGGYKHVRPQDRPHYSVVDPQKSARRLQRLKETQQRMQQGRKKG